MHTTALSQSYLPLLHHSRSREMVVVMNTNLPLKQASVIMAERAREVMRVTQ